MQPFVRLAGPAAPIAEDNVDTDIIYPARFLLRMEKTGLGDVLFRDRRFTPDGTPRPDFVLNREPWRRATILVAGRNFGCGSSREQAVWALADFGIRCVIAASFGDIFRGNCLQNGILPVRLPDAALADVAGAALLGEEVLVDLDAQRICLSGQRSIDFTTEPAVREALMMGWDATEMILQRERSAIAAFQERHRAANPWLFAQGACP
ncbi:3-isopropylmalate dehydratase small subunit [Sphingomonas bacterium]|uniref:3-isopropylmalate dehydratase small subunit n=1 Tax=Sphingomonas bacterium TaxID=1895847 RepID=UPI001576B5F5|nr:3-isopropylmalate dehydratase small subunit [Sphingomonas bacterium]